MLWPEWVLSFTPGFSPVRTPGLYLRTVSTVFCSGATNEKPLKRFLRHGVSMSTGLKPGVNETRRQRRFA
jgi:hypothetical protein